MQIWRYVKKLNRNTESKGANLSKQFFFVHTPERLYLNEQMCQFSLKKTLCHNVIL